jgi:hypothetical protein
MERHDRLIEVLIEIGHDMRGIQQFRLRQARDCAASLVSRQHRLPEPQSAYLFMNDICMSLPYLRTMSCFAA